MILNYASVTLNNLLETHLKLKILFYLNREIPNKKKYFLKNSKYIFLRIFLKIIYCITLKKVFSSKITNRMVIHYFKNNTVFYKKKHFYNLKLNKANIDLHYKSTLAINSLYELAHKLLIK